MQEKLKNAIDELVSKWNNLAVKQKATIIAIAISLILVLVLTIVLSNRTVYKRLMRDPLDEKTVYSLTDSLTEAGIKNKIINGSYIDVDEKKYDAAKRIVSDSNVIDKGYTFDDALDSIDMGTTSDTKKEIMKQQKQDELRRLLEEMEVVDKARVLLYMPDDTSFFLKNQQEASASVVITSNGDLNQIQIDSIVNLIKASVNGMSKENIEVVDSNGSPLYSGEDNIAGGASANYRLELEKRRDIESKAEDILGGVFSRVEARASIALDLDRTSTSKVQYAPPIDGATKGIPQQQNVSSSSAKNTAGDSEPGLAQNGGNMTNYQMGNAASSEGKTDETSTLFALNETRETQEKAIGKVLLDQSSLSVIVYRDVNYRQEDLEANGTLNENMTWEQYQDQIIQNLNVFQVDQDLQTAVQNATGINNLSIIGYESPKFIPKEIINRPYDQYVMLAILVLLIALLAFGLIKKTAPAEVTEIEPELSVEEVLETYNKRQEYVSPIDYDSESEVKKQIEKFVDERPEAVAQLLRNWLSSDWE